MPVIFKIIPELRLIIARPIGRLTMDDMFGYFSDLRAHPDWARGLDRIVDNRRMTDIDMSYSEMCNLRAHELPPSDPQAPLPNTIFVCTDDIGYGMARMYKSIEHDPPKDQVSIVENFEMALNILQLPRDSLEKILND